MTSEPMNDSVHGHHHGWCDKCLVEGVHRAATPERREDGWDELRREIEALKADRGDAEWDTVARQEVLAIVDRLAAARGEPPELREAFADLRDAVELMDTKVSSYGQREDGTTTGYIVPDSTWHRVLAVARGSTSVKARAAIDAFRAVGLRAEGRQRGMGGPPSRCLGSPSRETATGEGTA